MGVGVAGLCAGEAVGYGGLQDCGGIGGDVGGRELVQEALGLGLTPEIVERDDASGDDGGWDAEYGVRGPQVQAHGDGTLAGANEFSTDLVLGAHGVEVEAILG